MKISRFFAFLTALFTLLAAIPSSADGVQGTPFFLLSDAAYGSADSAMVRLEAQNMGPIAESGGVDVYVYRVKQPLAFLKAQKNLHRIDSEGDFTGPGLSNALARVWDTWWTDSRKTWRKLFSADARQAVASQAPEVRSHPLLKAATPESLNPQYRPLKAHTLVDSFRYPVHLAQPIQPPEGVKLAGSSSDFIQSPQGNVLIPLGKKEPGLYLVEAMVGDHRATTLVFVSDSIAVTKVSSKQMLVWVADRRNGKPVAAAKTVWSDGVGVLATGDTDKRGVVTFQRSAPEKTYVYGEDPQGGVYVAENYYYDSEIYNTKLYAVTDRPLYRPGETVFVKFLGRTFQTARESTPITAGELKLQVFDANGFPIAGQTLQLTAQTGGDTSFQLPDNAVAGGYGLRFEYQGNAYGAAFRVAEYQKPHFEIKVLPEKRDFKTNEEIKGKLQLFYPDGKPVTNAKAELTVRAQRLTMIEGDLGYAGQFPLQLTSATLTTDAKGMANFALPAATEPSRYVLSVLATDGAAYRVRVTREILIERGAGTYALKSERAFSAVGESVDFAFQLLSNPGVNSTLSTPTTWDWVRLENRRRESGKLTSTDKLSLTFAEPGTYTVSLRDAAGNLVGAATHYVSGAGVAAPQGSIEMVFDKSSYKPGETASALITFPQQVEQALFTLERDKVEKTSLMAGAVGWVRAKRLSPLQWRVEIPVKDDYGPNITFSVVYVKGGEYVFQNLGLKVEQPRIDVTVRADKAVYAPGDKVTLDLTALIGAKAAAGSQLTVGVVDEMIYVLQPEIAPDIFDFFYHPRRNNVRTSASLSFIAYDLAKPPSQLSLPSRSQTHQRAIKILERPRREDKDTALWQPNVTIDADGHAKVTFIMPDSLTRWRVTVRATAPSGTVGQNVSYLRSDKDFYVKWTSPNWMRAQDAPNASVAIFNQGNQEATVELSASGTGLKRRDNVKLKPGANFVALPLNATATDARIDLALVANGKTVDALTVPLKIVPLQWQSQRSLSIPLAGKEAALKLPADAANLRLQFADGAAAQFRRLMDDLIDYPYGCVEQTSSRLIPYSLALQSLLPNEERLAAQLTQRLHSHRFRLAQMAGPLATFGWWSPPSEKDADAFLTAYAYYADWHASRALKLALPPGHFDRLLEVYRHKGVQRSAWHRALMLYWMQEMGLPVRSLAEALAEELASGAATNAKAARLSPLSSMMLAQDQSELHSAMSTLLAAYVVQQTNGKLAPNVVAAQKPAAQRVHQAGLPLAEALLLLTGKRPAADAGNVLETVRAEAPTIDRALTLLWTYRALNGTPNALLRGSIARIEPGAPWQAVETATGQRVFRWPAATALPTTIKLATSPAPGTTAVAQFDSREAETTSLPVQVERRIYRLVKSETAANDPKKRGDAAAPEANSVTTTYALKPLPADAVLKTDEVYLDEIVLKHNAGAPLRFGIVEVALPPGSTADRATWGINLQYPGGKPAEALEQARYEQTPRGYAVPVDTLDGTLVIRHLLRAAQTGKFMLPPARYYRMYQPEQKAFEGKPRASIEIR
ncbi:MAG: alpha-2-macroglobulin family protein [Sulfuricella sp.]|nr:alpha-2-macroglobulin family protein [Sulfuricella sp.]